jgi:cytochrome oxidase Cu insertion factor (SCO1/SenC/PrrC family)
VLAVLGLALGIMGLGTCMWTAGADAAGAAAPAFSGTTLDGNEVSLESYHGKPLVLLFWGSW